jgi:hypothetical protein
MRHQHIEPLHEHDPQRPQLYVSVSPHSKCSVAGTLLLTPHQEKPSSIFEEPGLADRTFSNLSILSPVDRGAKMPAVLSFRVDVYIWRMSALRAKPDANVSLDHLAGDQGRRGEHRSARCGRLSRFIINCTSRYR